MEPVRCGSSNRCSYCAMFAALEAALVLRLDAGMRQPTVGLTTTTRRADFTLTELRKAEQLLWKQLRREREPAGVKRRDCERGELIEYCGFLEFTTGEGSHAAGVRRPHIHHLTKGIPGDDPDLAPIPLEDGTTTNLLERRVSELWRRFTGDAWVVECRPLRTPAGAIAYLSLHHHKRAQAPPVGFTGRRLRPSKGYYEQPIAELRELAQRLAAQRRVASAVRKTIATELYHDPTVEHSADAELTSALVHGLRDLADDPLELQLSLDGRVDHEQERAELVKRTTAMLEQIRREHPSELVLVSEQDVVDGATGEAVRVARSILGAVQPRQPRQQKRAA